MEMIPLPNLATLTPQVSQNKDLVTLPIPTTIHTMYYERGLIDLRCLMGPLRVQAHAIVLA